MQNSILPSTYHLLIIYTNITTVNFQIEIEKQLLFLLESLPSATESEMVALVSRIGQEEQEFTAAS